MPILSLDEFEESTSTFFAPGKWVVEYHDRSHLPTAPQERYIKLGEMEINKTVMEKDGDNEKTFFRFFPTPRRTKNGHSSEETSEAEHFLETLIEDAFKEVKSNKKIGIVAKDAARCIIDQIQESIARLGLMQMKFEIDDQNFCNRKFAVIILDTNALRDGSIRHLEEQFPSVKLWAIIPLVTLMEVGEATARITEKSRETKQEGYSLLRTRPQTTIIPQEVQWIKNNLPTEILELVPELFRTFRGYESSKDPDRILINDRLILEGIKDLRRHRGWTEGVYLMSRDKDMARLARLEGIHTIYPDVPSITELDQGIFSDRFSLETRKLVSCSVQRFVWDLTHVFSKIRLRCITVPKRERGVELFYYYPTKLVNDWVDDRLEVTWIQY